LVPKTFQAAAVAAKGDDTFRTTVVDVVRKIDWPRPFTARVLKTRFCTEWHGREAALGEPPVLEREVQRYLTAAGRGGVDNAGVLGGEGVALMREMQPAGRILRQIVSAAEDLLAGKAGAPVATQ